MCNLYTITVGCLGGGYTFQNVIPGASDNRMTTNVQ